MVGRRTSRILACDRSIILLAGRCRELASGNLIVLWGRFAQTQRTVEGLRNRQLSAGLKGTYWQTLWCPLVRKVVL